LLYLGINTVTQTKEQMFLASRGFGGVSTITKFPESKKGIGTIAIEVIVREIPHWDGTGRPLTRGFASLNPKQAEIILSTLEQWEEKKMEVWEILNDISYQRYKIHRLEILALLLELKPEDWVEICPNVMDQTSERQYAFRDLLGSASADLRKAFNDVIKVEATNGLEESRLMVKAIVSGFTESFLEWVLGEHTPKNLQWYIENGIPMDTKFSAETLLIDGKTLLQQVNVNEDFVKLPAPFIEGGNNLTESTAYITPVPSGTGKWISPRTTWMSKVALLSNMALDEILEDVKFIPGPPKF
jgi:hypothetical protein